jgi:hypothetical protein
MNSSGPLHPHRRDGSAVDATFELSSVPVYELVFHHKAGARDSPQSLNADYHEGLELLLDRLGSVGCTILGISVDSSIARELADDERELTLGFPLVIDGETNIHALRLEITRAQRTIARRPDAKPGGGNDQKRIRLTLALDGALDFGRLRQLLLG